MSDDTIYRLFCTAALMSMATFAAGFVLVILFPVFLICAGAFIGALFVMARGMVGG